MEAYIPRVYTTGIVGRHTYPGCTREMLCEESMARRIEPTIVAQRVLRSKTFRNVARCCSPFCTLLNVRNVTSFFEHS